jgi:hypothetical protein
MRDRTWWLGRQDSNFEIPISENAFEIAHEISAIQGDLSLRDFFASLRVALQFLASA